MSRALHHLVVSAFVSIVSLAAADTRISVGALNLPAGSTGLFHLRTGETSSMPVQTSTRYFSEPASTSRDTIELYAEPVGKDTAAIKPLLKLPLPAGTEGACHLLLWSSPAEKEKPAALAGRILPAKEWPQGSMLLLNASSISIGIEAGDIRHELKAGTSHAYPGSNPEKDLPVKLYAIGSPADAKAKPKLVFSSVWRIATDRRELCVIHPSTASRGIAVRSLLERPQAPDTP